MVSINIVSQMLRYPDGSGIAKRVSNFYTPPRYARPDLGTTSLEESTSNIGELINPKVTDDKCH